MTSTFKGIETSSSRKSELTPFQTPLMVFSSTSQGITSQLLGTPLMLGETPPNQKTSPHAKGQPPPWHCFRCRCRWPQRREDWTGPGWPRDSSAIWRKIVPENRDNNDDSQEMILIIRKMMMDYNFPIISKKNNDDNNEHVSKERKIARLWMI